MQDNLELNQWQDDKSKQSTYNYNELRAGKTRAVGIPLLTKKEIESHNKIIQPKSRQQLTSERIM
jgi:hypothetical protein